MSQTVFTPANTAPEYFSDAKAALAAIRQLYDANTAHLRAAFHDFTQGKLPPSRISACYPYVAITPTRQPQVDPRLAYGFVPGPGRYQATLTRPDLFDRYYTEQFTRLLQNHDVQLEVGISDEPIPIHFAYPAGMAVEADLAPEHMRALRDTFDVPDITRMHDAVANGTYELDVGDAHPLALFSAERVDVSLHRLRHYTGTDGDHFQNFIIFTNYQFYVDEFQKMARALVGTKGYTGFVEPTGSRLPQMPAYHLQRKGHTGITLVNIGVGPSNAKTITDHIAVLRPHAWLMLGHCAGLRAAQRLGDYVLAHAYVRDDHVLDADLPTWVPIPALAEIQTALERAVAEITGQSGYDVKSIMRTGTVVSIDNRNWELREQAELWERFSQSRAIALDMESATIAANGFRFRVPYGTLLCISDKPLHGEMKLPGMADKFYRERVDQHLQVGIRAMELLAEMPSEQLHSRKLRSFVETAFQ
jgi:AMP nucleosidase